MTDLSDKPEYVERVYKGQLFKKKGTTNDTEWKMYELIFAGETRDDGKDPYDWKITAFAGSEKLPIDTLEEGELYKIGFIRKVHPNNVNHTVKNLVFLEKSDGEKPQEGKKMVRETGATVEPRILDDVKKAFDSGDLEESTTIEVTLTDGSKKSLTVKEVLAMRPANKNFN